MPGQLEPLARLVFGAGLDSWQDGGDAVAGNDYGMVGENIARGLDRDDPARLNDGVGRLGERIHVSSIQKKALPKQGFS